MGFIIDDGVLIKYTGRGEEEVIIPDGVTSIDDMAFYGCENLISVSIPNSVKSIGDSAFFGCWSLESISLPDSVTNIGHKAFCDCKSLTIHTSAESYAAAYAKSNKIRTVS